MKASEMDKGLEVTNPSDEENSYYILPQHVRAYKTFQQIGLTYERNTSDRTWDWWVKLVTAEPVKDQEIKRVVTQMYRIVDPSTGNEFLFYNEDRRGVDWKNNPVDMALLEGISDNIPLFRYDRDPSTGKVISGSTQVLEVTKEYTIPFKKEKVDELSKYFRTGGIVSCIVVAPDGRKYSVSLEQFKSTSHSSLIDMVTGYADYMKSVRGKKVYQ